MTTHRTDDEFAALLAEAVRTRLDAEDAYDRWARTLPMDAGHDYRCHLVFEQHLELARATRDASPKPAGE